MEIWKDIKGYEGLYQVSNIGRVKSLPRTSRNKYNTYQIGGRVLKSIVDRTGYLHVVLQFNGNKRFSLIHRLVAETFLLPEVGKTEVNHKDENKTNNCVDNLEWCSRTYNMNYGSRPNVHAKRVMQFTKDNKYITSFTSAKEAERKTGVNHGNICSCCRGNTKYAGGYKWTYK